MNKSELIDSLDDQHLLSLVELLTHALMMPEERLWYIASEELYYDLPAELVDYCEVLTDYQRLKLMQCVINTLVAEAEKPTVPMLQLALPLVTDANSCIATCPTRLLKPNYGHNRNQQQRH